MRCISKIGAVQKSFCFCSIELFHINFSQLFVVESQMCAKFTPNALQLFQIIWNVSRCQSASLAFCDCRPGLNTEEGKVQKPLHSLLAFALLCIWSDQKIMYPFKWSEISFFAKMLVCIFILSFFQRNKSCCCCSSCFCLPLFSAPSRRGCKAVQCTMVPILNGQFYHVIFKNIGLNLFGSKQPRERLVFVILKL